ncbi:MAG: MBL fold metallo-hydrolase [Clostridiales bacterium]|nr:MBL fold metallo-hydrolase [Clostridiales bacterium]
MIDFSCKHDILLEDEDGSLQPMDEPYFKAWNIRPGTCKILSDGDYSYLLEGDDEGLLVDSGYGAGNIRVFCEELINKPVKKIVNTHDHFDHTANNSYFDLAYMSEETKPLATIPFPSFDGIDFPRDYKIQVIGDGDIIRINGRELLVFKIPDHAVGSLAFLDKKARILFAGDEIGMPMGKPLNGSVERWAGYMEKLMKFRDSFDLICAGFGEIDTTLIERQLENAKHILEGYEGEKPGLNRFPHVESRDPDGQLVWKRRMPHPGDGPKDWNKDAEYKRVMDFAGCKIIYDIRKIREQGRNGS